MSKEEEIVELRQAVGLMTTLKPTMEMDAEHPLAMMQEVHAYVSEENSRLLSDRNQALDQCTELHEEMARMSKLYDRGSILECERLRQSEQRLIEIAKRAVQMDRDLVPMIDPGEGNGKMVRLALANHGRDARAALQQVTGDGKG